MLITELNFFFMWPWWTLWGLHRIDEIFVFIFSHCLEPMPWNWRHSTWCHFAIILIHFSTCQLHNKTIGKDLNSRMLRCFHRINYYVQGNSESPWLYNSCRFTFLELWQLHLLPIWGIKDGFKFLSTCSGNLLKDYCKCNIFWQLKESLYSTFIDLSLVWSFLLVSFAS